MEDLIKIQNELKAPKNQTNKFGGYKYRSCEDILEALKPILLKYNAKLFITDEIKEIGGIIYVEATASIIINENQVSVKAQAGIEPNKKGMDVSQSFGSSSSYARKYALNGLFLIDDTKDSDAINTHGKSEKIVTLEDVKTKLSEITTEIQLNQYFKSLPKEIAEKSIELFKNRKTEIC